MTLFSRFNHMLDKSCSLLVGSSVALVDAYCVMHFDASLYVPVFTANACLTAGLSKGLKRLLHQSRPPGAPKLSPGMPSNHATSLSFLCVSSVFGLQKYHEGCLAPQYTPSKEWRLCPIPTVPDIPASWIVPLQSFLVVYSLYLTGLRVTQGHHTVAQVVVGYTFGASCAALCLAANYAGYSGTQLGGRIDELSWPMKIAAVTASTLLALVTARAVFRGSVYSRRANAPATLQAGRKD